jgi:hypothetical protein
MVKFNGANAVYDAGFYNLGIRPTPEDLSIGATINVGNGAFPLSLGELKRQIAIIAGGGAAGPNLDPVAIAAIGNEIPNPAAFTPGQGVLQFPTSMQTQPGIPANLVGPFGGGIAIPPLGINNLAPRPFAITTACGPGLNGNGVGAPNNNPNINCVPNIAANEFILRNGAFKAQGLLDVRYTGPHFHNGSKMSLRQVFNFYKTAGALVGPTAGFPNLNLANLDAGLRIVNLAPDQESAVIEMMETGLTDWGSVYEEGVFSHPQLCVAVGHDPATGESIMADLHANGAVGFDGNNRRLQTFAEAMLGDIPGPSKNGTSSVHEHDFSVACDMPGVTAAATPGVSAIDVPPQ